MSLLAVACVATLSAQEDTAQALRVQLAVQPRETSAWFETGFDLVEAQLACDVAAAVATANDLLATARRGTDADLQEVAAAFARLAVAIHEGPARVAQSVSGEVAAGLGGTADARRRARFHTVRARQAWLADVPDEFIVHAFAGLDAARTAADPVLQLRAGWALHQVTAGEAEAFDVELLREVDLWSTDPRAASLSSWHAINAYWRVSAAQTPTERLQGLERVANRAIELGDVRTRVFVEWDRAVVGMAVGEFTAVERALTAARELATKLGDRRMLAISVELAAECAFDRQQHGLAVALLTEAAALVADRGYSDREVHQAHLLLRIASQQRDHAAVATQTARLETLRRAEAQRYRGYVALREQLIAGERQRGQFEQRLAAEQERAAQTLRAVRGYVAVSVAGVLGIVAWLTLRSRRRLWRVHQALQQEVRRAESEAQARQALEQRMRALERAESLGLIASGIAHDFNNLMTGVLGNAELLRAAECDPERARQLEAISAAGERGARLCSQLQAYAGDEPIRFESLDMAAIVRGLAPVLDAAVSKRLQLTVAVPAEPVPLRGNSTQLEQAILNLVTNARDARASHVHVRMARVVMGEGDWRAVVVHGEPGAGAFVCLEVEDDGEGMSAELVKRIFDPFFTTRFPGRGLGLAVVFGAMRRHQGALTVDSQPGRGTRFRLYIPQASAPALVAAPVASPPAEPTAVLPMTVLVVDDEAHIRDYVATVLRRRGHQVHGVGEGAAVHAALLAMGAAPRVVALVDLSMPLTDGRDVVRVLRSHQGGPAVVLMSGHAHSHLADTARDLAADGYVSKPFIAGELEIALDAALARRAMQVSPVRRSG